MSESDGMEETFEGQLRVGLLIAGRMAEEVARLREQAAREAEARSLQAVREQQERVAVERSMARAALAPVERDGWWQRARAHDVAAAWQTARTWEAVEPDARRVADTIREQVRTRYGLDIDILGFDPAAERVRRRAMGGRDTAVESGRAGADQIARAAQERAVAILLASESAVDRASGDGGGLAGDVAVSPAAAAVEAALQTRPPAYDSPRRRQERAEDLSRTVGPQHSEAVEAHIVADKANSRPPIAITGHPSLAGVARARRSWTLGRGQQSGVER